MIKDFSPRLYQETILVGCTEKNTLVVLPTGLGKTNIFMMLTAHVLMQHPESRILLLGPTRPLISQYKKTFEKHFEIDPDKMAVFTGQVSPEKRKEIWDRSKIIFSTPQGLENDIISGRISLEDVSLLGFDEAHRATGNYSYVWVAKKYMDSSKYPRIVGMTASPGDDLEKITGVCKNLFIENVEVRTEEDPDVKPYVHETKIKYLYVELPSLFNDIIRALNKCYDSKVDEAAGYGIVKKENLKSRSKRDILKMQGFLQSEIAQGKRDIEILKTISLLAEALKVQHAIELIETQGVSVLNEYLENIFKQAPTTKTKSIINLSRDINFRTALIKSRSLKEARVEHPKLSELKDLVAGIRKKDPDPRMIIFCQYRDSINRIAEELEKVQGAKVHIFVGQAKKKGQNLSQKEQINVLNQFREGEFNILVTSSVGEEGLDIPSVNYVIFYEPIPSAIRTIQRKGRTGRHDKGEVVVLVARGTRDEAYRWTAQGKQKRMHLALDRIRQLFASGSMKASAKPAQPVVPKEEAEEIIIYADHREKGSDTIKKLIDLGVKLRLEQLDIGDYVLSTRLGVEFKTVKDFVDSIIDKRLLIQAKELKKYEKPVIIIEGTENIYSQRNIHHNAINGILATLMIDYGIPVIRTADSTETSLMLLSLAKREQTRKKEDFTLHAGKPLSLLEQQEYIISALPGVGGILSKPLLERFGSVKDVINATEDELKDVKFIGDVKAKNIRKVIDSPYKKR